MVRGGHEVYRKTWHFYKYLLNQVLDRRDSVISLKLGLMLPPLSNLITKLSQPPAAMSLVFNAVFST